jgi:membrane glycosyltransferase
VLTADPALGHWMRRWGLCGIPEDFDTPGEVRAVMGSGR